MDSRKLELKEKRRIAESQIEEKRTRLKELNNEYAIQQNRDGNISRGIGMFMAVLAFIGIFLIMWYSITWDGSKPGGWGLFLAVPFTFAVTIISAFIFNVSFTKLSYILLEKNTDKKIQIKKDEILKKYK